MELAQALAIVVRRTRRAKGWTLEGLAERAGLHRNHVVKVEGATTKASLDVFMRLAQAFGERGSSLLARVERRMRAR